MGCIHHTLFSFVMHRSYILDLLRIFAIALVFVAHIGQAMGSDIGGFFGIKNVYYVSLGGVGVSLFLILSGVLAGLTETHRKTAFHEYLIKKALRIYPPYWMSVVTGFMAFVIAGGLWFSPGEWFPSGFSTDILGSVTGFYSWLGLWGGPYNPPSWFIALIMSLYALFPLTVWAMKKQPHLTLLALFIISLVCRVYLGRYGLPFGEKHFWDGAIEYAYRQYGFMPGRPTDWFPLCRIFEFGLGIYLALVLKRSVWFAINLPGRKVVGFLSDLSFPLFLVHYPLLFLLDSVEKLGDTTAIALYFAAVFCLAYPLSKLDEKFPRKKISHLLGLDSKQKKE